MTTSTITPVDRLIAQSGAAHAHLTQDQIHKMALSADVPRAALDLWLATFHIEKSPTCTAAIAARTLATWLWAYQQLLQNMEGDLQ